MAADETAAEPAVGGWRSPALAYLLTFLALTAPLLPRLASSVPLAPNLEDAHVLPWMLAWVAHALAVDPRAVFDANISYPAPLQLTGTDPLFAAQLLFAPAYALTRNAVLATNLVILLGYPLAALAMERLLRRFAISAEIAWVAGLVFALGVLRVPFNVNELAYPNLVLPWTALALTRLRDAPSPRHGAALLLAFAVGVFAGLYAAVLVGLTAAVWGLFELARRGKGRGAFLAYALGAAIVAGCALLIVIQPYLASVATRSKGGAVAPGFKLSFASLAEAGMTSILLLGLYPQSTGLEPRRTAEVVVLVAAGSIAILAWLLRARPAARLVPRAATLWLGFGWIAWGYPPFLVDLVVASPLTSFRYIYRYVVPADFGLIILLGVALESVRARFGTRLARIATAAVLLLVLWDRGLPLALSPMHRVQAFTPEARATYDEVAQLVAAEGDGPLLELPIFGLLPGTDQSGRTLEPDAMLASTLHWWPTPAAHLSYHPAHRGFFMAVAEALSLPRNLADLVDLTHVRWLLLRPAAQWLPGTRPTVMSTLSSSPDVGRISQLHGGWTLVRLDRVPQHAQWFENVRRGGAQGLSVLGSPLAPIPEAQAIASVRLESTLGEGTVGQKVLGRATVRNGGDRPWAVVPTPLAPLTLDGRWANESSRDGTVVLMERWRKLDANGEPSAAVLSEHESHLRHDVDPGEELRQLISLTLPAEPGAYQLELQVAQVGGATFTAAGNSPERRRVEVKAAPPAGG